MNKDVSFFINHFELPSWKDLLGYFLGVLFAFTFFFVLLFALMRSAEGVYWNNTVQTLRAWIEKKHELATATSSPKIILLGGSNVFYGLSADLLSKRFSVPVVNFGLHGALPLSFYVYELDKIAKPGDLVIFAPEFNYYFLSPWESNQESLRYLFFDRQEFLISNGPFLFLKTLLQTPPDFFFARFLHSCTSWKEATEKQSHNANYVMNSFGDYALNDLSSRSSHQFEELKAGKPVEEFISATSTDFLMDSTQKHFFPFLRNFQEWANQKNVTLSFTWPSIQKSPYYENDSSKDFFHRFQSHIEYMGISVIGSPFDSMLSQDNFYDTIYHLHKEAALMRTAELIHEFAPLVEEWKRGRDFESSQK